MKAHKRAHTKTFEVFVGGKPYEVKATPYLFNSETRYRVSLNGSPVYVFTWDDLHNRLYVADKSNAAEFIPDTVEMAIAEKLQAA